LKAENETILRNLDRDKLNLETAHGDTVAQISNLQREMQQRDASLTELRSSLEESSKQVSALNDHHMI